MIVMGEDRTARGARAHTHFLSHSLLLDGDGAAKDANGNAVLSNPLSLYIYDIHAL